MLALPLAAKHDDDARYGDENRQDLELVAKRGGLISGEMPRYRPIRDLR